MEYFVKHDSVVRKIWGKSDTVLFIFAGASAEFALNKAVDWLYFTGRLPSDPLGRLFSTVEYARRIVFSSREEANKAIDTMARIHNSVEKQRGATIPDWAYRDVLFMLIYYSVAAFEILERRLSIDEKEEIYNVFYRVGIRMGLKELPANYKEWLPAREAHLNKDLQKSNYTKDLFKQYRLHLGAIRYLVLIEAQKIVVPERVKELLGFGNFSFLSILIPVYKVSRLVNLDKVFKNIILPPSYKKQIYEIDMIPAT